MLIPHICCPSMTTPEATVARRTRGIVNSSMALKVRRNTVPDSQRPHLSTHQSGAFRCSPSEVVVSSHDLLLLLKLNVDVVQVSGRLELGESQSDHRLPRLLVSVLLHEPSGRLGAEENSNCEREGGDEGGSELQSPGDGSGVLNDDVGGESEEDTEGGPELPSHDERSPDGGGRELSGEDGDGGSLGSHSDTEEESNDEELLPRLGESRADGGDDEDEGGNEDNSSSSHQVVERVRKPASHKGRGDVRGSVDLGGRSRSHQLPAGTRDELREGL